MKSIHTALWPALLCASTVTAQVASYTSFGSSCSNQLGVDVELNSTLPVPGTVMTVDIRGKAGTQGFLNFSPRWYTSGLDLSNAGMTGCRLYVKPEFGITLPLTWLPGSNETQVSFFLPTNVPKGLFYVNQAFAILPGSNAAGVVTSNAGLGRTGMDADLTPQQITAFAPLIKFHPDHYVHPSDPLEYIAECTLQHDTLGLDTSYNKFTRRWDLPSWNWNKNNYINPPMSIVNSFGMHPNGKNRRPNDPNRGSEWNVYLDVYGYAEGPHNPNGESPIFTYYRRVGDYHHEVQYWFLMGKNWRQSGSYEGQWQHMTVHVRFGNVIGAFFGTDEYKGSYFHRDQMQFSGTHPVAYISRDAQHLYPRPGTYNGQVCKDGGLEWQSWLINERLLTQPWRDFAGAWGEAEFTSATTGHLGPWHKRNDR